MKRNEEYTLSSLFIFPDTDFPTEVILFGVDMSPTSVSDSDTEAPGEVLVTDLSLK